jgi:hypothetical protein
MELEKCAVSLGSLFSAFLVKFQTIITEWNMIRLFVGTTGFILFSKY